MLSADNKLLFKKLYQISDLINKIWEKQYNTKEGRLSLYPKEFDLAKFLRQAEKDKDLLSPYTVIKKDKEKYLAVNYKDEYKNELLKIEKILNEAVKVAKNVDSKFADYLKKIQAYFKVGEYDKLEIEFVKYEGDVNIIFGPLETYEDTILGIKKTYQFIMTHRFIGLKTMYMSELQKLAENVVVTLPKNLSKENFFSKKIDLEFTNVVSLAGRFSVYPVSTICFPNNHENSLKYGNKIQIFMNTVNNRVTSNLLIAKKYFADCECFKIDNLNRGYLLMGVIQQVFDVSVRYADSKERLGKYYDMVRETASFVLAIQTCSSYLAKGWISREDFKCVIRSITLFGIDSIRKRCRSASYMQYAKGFILLFNFSMKNKVFTERDGKFDFATEIDMKKVAPYLEKFVDIYSKGNVKDIEKIIAEYGSFEYFDKRFA